MFYGKDGLPTGRSSSLRTARAAESGDPESEPHIRGLRHQACLKPTRCSSSRSKPAGFYAPESIFITYQSQVISGPGQSVPHTALCTRGLTLEFREHGFHCPYLNRLAPPFSQSSALGLRCSMAGCLGFPWTPGPFFSPLVCLCFYHLTALYFRGLQRARSAWEFKFPISGSSLMIDGGDYGSQAPLKGVRTTLGSNLSEFAAGSG